jgi:hypothetical protein
MVVNNALLPRAAFPTLTTTTTATAAAAAVEATPEEHHISSKPRYSENSAKCNGGLNGEDRGQKNESAGNSPRLERYCQVADSRDCRRIGSVMGLHPEP